MPEEIYLTPDVLTEIDRLWAIPDMPLRNIQARMATFCGIKFTQDQLRDAARRNDVAPADRPMGAPVVLMLEKKVQAPVDRVRLVAPGTFPARQFTMIGRRMGG